MDASATTPLVSLLVITYNQQDVVEETLASAVEQDYDRLEVIVADDASTDDTPRIISAWAERQPGRVVPVLGRDRRGVVGNSNRGLEAVGGEYVAFLDGDDLLLPGKISAQV